MKTNTIHHSLRLHSSAVFVAAALFATGSYAASADTHADTHVDDRPVTAAPAVTRDGKAGGELDHTDRRFLEKAAKAGLEEVEISRIAVERSTNEDVKRFAQTMVDDHSRANDEVAALAQKHGVTLPAKDAHDDRWRKRDAKDFDRDYIKKMVSDHKDVVDLFRKEAKDGVDPEILDFARKTLPKLEKHYEQANDLKKMVR